MILLWVAGLGAAAQFAKIGVPFALVRDIYPDAGFLISWLLTLVSVSGALLGMVAGRLVTQIGLGPALMIGLVLGGLASAFQTLVPGLNWMLLSRLIEGLSHLMIVVAAPTLIAQICSDRYRGVGMTLWSTFFGVGFTVVAWGGLPLAEAYSVPFLWAVHAGLMFATALGVWASWRHLPQVDRGGRLLGLRPILQDHRLTYGSPFIGAPALGWLFYALNFVALVTVLPELLPVDQRAIIAGAMPLVSIVVSLVVVSALLVRFSSISVIIMGFIASGCVLMTALLDLPLPWVCIALFAALGLVQGASFAAVPELNKRPEDQALAYGAMAQTGNIGNLLGTPILMAVLTNVGQDAMFLVVAGFYLAGVAIHVRLRQARLA
ncbi:MAG: MFS transporter [Pseudomonadota bacterium]